MAKKSRTKIKDMGKLPKRFVSVDEILDIQQTADAIDILTENKLDIEEFVLIYTKRNEDTIRWFRCATVSRTIYLMEIYKNDLLNPDNEE